MTTIVPGVLNGSQGPLHYEPEEIAKAVKAWDQVDICVNHPYDELGNPISVKHPSARKNVIGFLRNSRFEGKLQHEGWFDVENTKRVDHRVYNALERGEPMELSTGLHTDNVDEDGKSYARNHRPDHLAVLPDHRGACSIDDGCGVLVNVEKRGIWEKLKTLLGIADNSLGRGNHGYAKLKAHAESLSASASTADEHKAAGDAHMEASQEAAQPKATGGETNYSASGAHKVKAQEHYDKAAAMTNNAMTEAYKTDAENARGASQKAEKASDAGDHSKAADAHYDAAVAQRKAASHDNEHAQTHMEAASQHSSKGDDHYMQSVGLTRNNSKGGSTMTAAERKSTVAFLTTNCKCEEPSLNKLSDERLLALKVAHESHAKRVKKLLANVSDDEDDEDDEDDSEMEEENRRRMKGKKTNNLSADDNEALQLARELRDGEKRQLIERLVANVKDKDLREAKVAKYNGKTVAQLREFAELLPEPARNTDPRYIGAVGGPASMAAPVANFDKSDDLLDLPTFNLDIDDETGEPTSAAATAAGGDK